MSGEWPGPVESIKSWFRGVLRKEPEPIRCPTCDRPIKPSSTTMTGLRGGPMFAPRPLGELEAVCAQQNGTTHEVSTRWETPNKHLLNWPRS